MKEQYIIGVDCSTQSLKVILFDIFGNIFKKSKRNYTFLSPKKNYAEIKSELLWNAFCKAVNELIIDIDIKNIIGIGIAYQRETFTLIDKNLKEIRPSILWVDQRANLEVEEIKKEFGKERFEKITGKKLDTLPSLPKIKWIKNYEINNFKRIFKLCDVGTYFNWKLTGSFVTSKAGADTTGLFNIKYKEWSEELLDYIDLPLESLPDVLDAGELAGRVDKKASSQTGLPEGLPVIIGGGDGQVFSIGVNSLNEEIMGLSLGTSVVWGINSNKFYFNNCFRTMVSCLSNKYYYESVIIAGAHTIKWFVSKFGNNEKIVAELLNVSPESLLDKGISSLNPGSDGLITLPYWKGSYNNSNLRGLTFGWSDTHGYAHFYRSIMEGIGFEIRSTIEENKKYLKKIKIGSGGGSSEIWCKIISDITGLEIETSKSTENTALGAAMIAAYGLGVYNDIDEASCKMYIKDKTYNYDLKNNNLYTDLYNSTYSVISKLIKRL